MSAADSRPEPTVSHPSSRRGPTGLGETSAEGAATKVGSVEQTTQSAGQGSVPGSAGSRPGRRLFGKDGLRGVANVEPVTAPVILKLGRAMAYVLRREADASRRLKVVVGTDTRLSGFMMESALCAGLTSMGVDVLLTGTMPTPGIAYITRSLRADAGVSITASQRPFEENGLTFFNREGYKLAPATERRIEESVLSGEIDQIRPTRDRIGRVEHVRDAVGRYVDFAKRVFPKGLTLEGVRIVVDTANGAAFETTPGILRELGADVIVCNGQPDGYNINRECGTAYPATMQKAVIDHRTDLGIANDGDGDRLILCDENAQVLDGDRILAMVGLDFLRRGRLKENVLVANAMSNHGLDEAISRAGGRVVRCQVGSRYLLDRMVELDANLGGEPCGHVVFRDFGTTGDGIITALQVLRIMVQTGRSLSQLARCMEPLPQARIDIPVTRKPSLDQVPELAAVISETKREIEKDGGYLLARYSENEPILRLLIEGKEDALLGKLAHRIQMCAEDVLSRPM
ncbi:MAG: phosphoglucosamine mutase [Verrucomicrobiota bacterium]|nr:phosphoglucosamine mutase [Verrucomicrobiota bacterium]